jgi:RNA polymerase sigma factor (sigma-70 family)
LRGLLDQGRAPGDRGLNSVQQGYCVAISLYRIAAVLCALILQSNRNDYRSSVSLFWATCRTRPLQVARIILISPQLVEKRCGWEVSLVPMNQEEFEAELQDWAKHKWLESLILPEITGPERQDIAQESWCRMREADPATINDFRAYAARIVNNVTIELAFGRRRVRRIIHVTGSDEFIESKCLEAGQVVEGPEEECDRQQREALLSREVGRLSPRCRQMLTLFHVDGLPAEQIAQQLGVTRNTVYSVVRHGVLQLIKKIRKFDPDNRPRRDKP